MKYHHFSILAILLTIFIVSCKEKNSTPDPWGTAKESSFSDGTKSLQLDDIIANGELIMVTISGPQTYYDYHGRGMGLHYLLLQNFCDHIGVSLRVDICKDTTDMIKRIEDGEADVMAMPMTKDFKGVTECLSKASDNKWHWIVNQENTSLADTLNNYFSAQLIKKVADEENYWLSAASIKRHVFSPMMNRATGEISRYDYYFIKYAPVAHCDWHLIAAQCYQESCFDPNARSWAGACGLMQIMPSTAEQLGLPQTHIFDPEMNIATAAKYLGQLAQKFPDVTNPIEKTKFILASYNGGSFHIRDAMALAKKHGYSPYRWDDVSQFVLRLQHPAYYNDPVVKHGYMRGSETVNYVAGIMNRWMDYRGVKGNRTPLAPSSSSSASSPSSTELAPNIPAPHPAAKRKAKYEL